MTHRARKGAGPGRLGVQGAVGPPRETHAPPSRNGGPSQEVSEEVLSCSDALRVSGQRPSKKWQKAEVSLRNMQSLTLGVVHDMAKAVGGLESVPSAQKDPAFRKESPKRIYYFLCDY